MAARKGASHQLSLNRLRELMIDPARFSTDEDVISGYRQAGSKDGLLAVVVPRSQVDIEQVLKVARDDSLSVYTPLPEGLNPPRPGVVIDFRYMAGVKDIDTRNLFLEVEPGVTWEQVLPELAVRRVRVALPAAASSPYVLENALERQVVTCASRYTNKQISTFHVLMADGREYRSGSDALPTSVAHWREDGGPNISRVFTGSRNSLAIPLRGFVFLYPEPEHRKVVVMGLPNRNSARRLAERAARSEIGTEVVLVNKLKGKDLLGFDPGLPTWSVVFGLEGSQRLVKYHQKRLGELAAGLKLKPKAGATRLTEAFSGALAKPWYAPELSIGFYTTFEKVEKFSGMAEEALKGHRGLAQMIIPVKRGASVYIHYDVHDPGKDAGTAIKLLRNRLSNSGAFFNNPTGAHATHIFKRQPAYFDLLKDIKRFLDPDDILNTGQMIDTR